MNMDELTTEIGTFDPVAKNVPVTFTKGEIVHERHVHAVLTETGAYDPDATAARVAEVAAGVNVKIDCGAIRNPPPEDTE
jgi:leucyl aminopeptidase (aminopeptidase T)